jgi:hypothetical protein
MDSRQLVEDCLIGLAALCIWVHVPPYDQCGISRGTRLYLADLTESPQIPQDY